ncbi:MAG: gamma-glutamyltransferase [Burkholderiales bacterium]
MVPSLIWRSGGLALALLALAFASGAIAQLGSPEADSGRQPKAVVTAANHLVVAAHPVAVDAGHAVLSLGGSALDAAIAVQAVLGLVEPQSSGIGGGAFLLHWSEAERKVRSYDGREAAPFAASEDRFLRHGGIPLRFLDAVASGASVGVPGLLRMLELAHRRHGRLPWRELFQYAIFAAEEGFQVTPRLNLLLERDPALRDDAAARRLYYRADGRAVAVGTRLRNPEYAQALRQVAARGADALYRGELAREIVLAVRAHARPGDLTLADLAQYRAIEREPVCGAVRGLRLCGMGPPSSGGIAVLQILGMLERTQFRSLAPASAQAVHLFAEAGRLAYADRAHYIADPAFSAQPVDGLLAPAYLEARARLIGERSMGPALPGQPEGALQLGAAPETEVSGTSHVSIVDAAGDAVSMTSTVESAFGSRIMVRGFLLNNQLTDFAFVPTFAGRPVANRVEGGKRPRSSMAPTLVFDSDGRLQMALGSPGGPQIINYVAKALVGVLDWGMDLQAAIELGNFGSRGGPTQLERGTSLEELGDALAERGHITGFPPLTSGVHGFERTPHGWRSGVDPRREGVARGR